MKINQYFEAFKNNNINDSSSNTILNVTFEKKNNNIKIRHKRNRKKLNSNSNLNLIDNENVPGINQNKSVTKYDTSNNYLFETTNDSTNNSSFNNERTYDSGPDTILTIQQVEKIEKEIKKIKRKRLDHNNAKHSQKYNNKTKIKNIFCKIGETIYKETAKIGLDCIITMAKKTPIIKEFKVYYTKETFEDIMKNKKKFTEEDALEFLLGMEEGLVTEKGLQNLTKQMRKKYPLPTLYAVRKAKSFLRTKIFRVYRNPNGQYVDAEAKIKYFIQKNFDLIKKNIENDTIRIKLCGDGFRKDRKSFFNFCFTLPDEGSIAKTSRGNYILGLFEIDKEDHTNLSLCLKNISENLEVFNAKGGIDINGNIYKIKFLLGGDMKFLRAAMGLNACNASNGCLWCTELTSNYHKNNKNDFNSKQRCINDFQQKKNGCINERIFKFITFDDVVFDTLHLLLRITEQLLSVVYLKLRTLDNNTSDLKMMKNQKKLFDHLTKIGIDKPYVIEIVDNYQKIKLRSFNGDECLKILEFIKFDEIDTSFGENENYQKIFNNFHDIFIKVKTNFYKDNSKELESDTDEWLKAFQYSFHSRHVTPYMHLFAGHLCFFVEKHGDVDIFNVQGLEKLNSLTKQYHRKTNNKNVLLQMFEKRNIAEDFIFRKTADQEKRQYSREKRKIHDEIIEKEELQKWVQYLIGKQRVYNEEMDQMNKGLFSWNVIILILFNC